MAEEEFYSYQASFILTMRNLNYIQKIIDAISNWVLY